VSESAPGMLMLARDGGSIAYEVRGDGPLVVCIPGMGDLRSNYRFLAPALVDAGYRVATFDLRGHGDSDATFSAFDDVAAGGDALALVERLDAGAAVLVGNSMGAGAAVWAAAERPDLVRALVLLGPFVRNGDASALMRGLFRVSMQRPWARAVWRAYAPTLYAGAHAPDHDAHLRELDASLGRPGHVAALVATSRTDHTPAEKRLADVLIPTLVVMGECDPDFKDPQAEARFVATATGGRVVMVPDAGHYPQAQRPDVVNPAVLDFLASDAAVRVS